MKCQLCIYRIITHNLLNTAQNRMEPQQNATVHTISWYILYTFIELKLCFKKKKIIDHL